MNKKVIEHSDSLIAEFCSKSWCEIEEFTENKDFVEWKIAKISSSPQMD